MTFKVKEGLEVNGSLVIDSDGLVDGRDVAADGAKLDGIEAGATADQTITAGAGLTGGGTGNVTLSHADTSTQASVNNSNGVVIQDVTLDTYGHITSIGSINLDSRYYTETESDAKYAPIFETISGVETWNKVHAAWTDSSGANTYIVITTNVPQDAYVMGGFELTLENNYNDSNEGDTVRIYGYWNPEANGGFIGFKYHATNPNFNPTIQVARNTSGNTVFIISGESTNYTQVIARNLWTGYNSPGANATWGDNWTITDTADISGYTNNNTVVRTGLLPHTLTLNGDVSGSVTLDGYSNKTMTITVADDSHNHTIANVDGLQAALDSKLNSSSYTAADVLTKIKTVDGATSGLDADLLDGQHGSYYTSYTDTAIANLVASAPATLDTLNELAAALGDDPNFATTVTNSIATKLNSSAYTAADVLAKVKTVDGSGSGLDADTLDGQHGSYYYPASNPNGYTTNTGTVTSVATGGGLTGGTITGSGTISHADTSSQASVNNSGATVIQDVTLDTYGHVTGLGSATLTASTVGALPISGGTLTGTLNYRFLQSQATSDYDTAGDASGFSVFYGTSSATNKPSGIDHAVATFSYSDAWQTQIAMDWRTKDAYFRTQENGTWKTWDKFWHSGNDGSGSGLDADLLDGQQGSYYYPASNPNGYTSNIGDITGVTAGSGLTGGGTSGTVTIAHADTSTQASLTALTGANVVSDIDVDGYGHVTALATRAMTASDIGAAASSHTHTFASLTSKPTTLSGYGITDAASSSHNHTLDSLSNTTITSIASGEILKWNGTAWVNNTLAEAGIQPAGSYLTGNQTITLSGDLSGSGTTSINAQIAANVVGANELKVTGNGTTAQYLRSDGDGSFTWATPPDTNTTYSAGTNMSLASTTFSVVASPTFTTVTATDFNTTSDARLKENVATLDKALDKVLAIRGVEFDWKETGDHTIGFIAQEVEEVLPELVSTDVEGMKSVKYGNMTAVLLEAIKELQAEVAELKSQLNNK